jgi:hypothetical protein
VAELMHEWREDPETLQTWDPYVNGMKLGLSVCPIFVNKIEDRRGGGFEIINTDTEGRRWGKRHGPFATLEEAIAAADLMHILKEYPR